jgi:hypothetical protein
MAEPCQNGETPIKLRPLRIITMISTPISVPMMEPRPPNRLAPPITTAAMASSSIAVPVNGSTERICAMEKVTATAASAPDTT